MIDQKAFRTALGQFPTGVAIVTAPSGDEPVGMTINSFGSVSLDPPLVQFGINRKANSFTRWLTAEHFAVHILSEHQIGLSNRFAKPLADKWSGVAVQPGLGGAPIIDGAICVFECLKWAEYDGGDHVIFVCEVTNIRPGNSTSRMPLVFHGGSYRQLASESGNIEAAEDPLLLHGW